MVKIGKVINGPSTALFPVPAVLVTSCLEGSDPDIITIAWTGVMCSDPPVVYISVRPVGRHSYGLIKESGEYVINIPTAAQARVVDYCGMVSGRDVNKFKETGLHPVPALHVKAPLIAECPVNIECRLFRTVDCGSHQLTIGEVVEIHASRDIVTDGKPDTEKLDPIVYAQSSYWRVGRQLAKAFSAGKEYRKR